MGEQLYKAVRHDYGSFHDPSLKYGPVGTIVNHPAPITNSRDARDYLSVSTSPSDCTGFIWRTEGKNSRLLVVEPIGEVWAPHSKDLPNKRAVTAVRIVEELPISAAFGPNGAEVEKYLDALTKLTSSQWYAARKAAWDAARKAAGDAAWYAAWDAARKAAGDAAWDAARKAAGDAARKAAWYAAWDAARKAAGDAARKAAGDAARKAAWYAAGDAAWDAAGAVVTRDLITAEQFDTLAAPMRAAGIDFDNLGGKSSE